MKLLKLKPLVIILILSILIVNIPLASAEVFVDLYAGWSHGVDEDLTFKATGEKKAEANFSNSFTVGYRLGYWFDRARWAGLALEASHFKHDIRQQGFDRGHLRIIPVSGLLMFRTPLLKTDDIYPEGGLFFYGGIGPGMFLSSIKYEVANSPISDMLNLPGIYGNYSDRSVDIGLDIRGGIAVMVRENISLFCEYRYTDFKPDFEEEIWGNTVKIETEVNTHHVLIGFSYHYN